MGLSERQRTYLNKRGRLLRYWRFVGVFLVLLWLGLVAWLWIAHPLLVNPIVVQQRLQTDRIAGGTVQLLAAMLPIAVDLALLLTLFVVVLVAVVLRNERRYRDIVHTLARDGDDRGV